MKKLCIFSVLAFYCSFSFASPSITTKCLLSEKASGTITKSEVLDITTLSPDDTQSVAMKPQMALDSNGLYILSLAKGKDHYDATNEINGADYYLSLIRQQDQSRSLKTKGLRGKLSDMVFIQVKYDSLYKVSHVNNKGKHIIGAPKSLRLDYKLSRGKKVKLKCEIISIR